MASVHECLVEVGRHVQSAAVSALIAVLTCTHSTYLHAINCAHGCQPPRAARDLA